MCSLCAREERGWTRVPFVVIVTDGNASNPVCSFANVTNVAGLQALARSDDRSSTTWSAW